MSDAQAVQTVQVAQELAIVVAVVYAEVVCGHVHQVVRLHAVDPVVAVVEIIAQTDVLIHVLGVRHHAFMIAVLIVVISVLQHVLQSAVLLALTSVEDVRQDVIIVVLGIVEAVA